MHAVTFHKTMKKLLLLAIIFSFSVASFGGATRDDFVKDLIKAAKDRTLQDVQYDGSYFSISYPNGDVPSNIGVCTDVIIRSFRKIGIDLQKKIHEDMLSNFSEYPSRKIWGLKKPDKNIDHRRVPNLQVFLKSLVNH